MNKARAYAGRLFQALYSRSPEQNLAAVKAKISTRRGKDRPPETSQSGRNTLLPNIWQDPSLLSLVKKRLGVEPGPIVLAGSFEYASRLLPDAKPQSWRVTEWGWENGEDLPDLGQSDQIVLLPVPTSRAHWEIVQQLKRRYGTRLHHLYEFILPLTVLQATQRVLPYFLPTLREIAPFLLGNDFFGPIHQLNAMFPLGGLSVIEFGPLDGAQTAGLVHCGVRDLTCIEARAENVIKTTAALIALGWQNVIIRMDDFHNVDASRYGRYDLAFAHGVYYHSIAPFVFLENLISLSDAIFLGGFCATPQLPVGNYEKLTYEGRSYRVKAYRESMDFMGGINQVGYFFDADDLMSFFRERGFVITVISNEDQTVTAGKYLRFVAKKLP